MANFYPFLYFACAALIAVSCVVVFRHNPRNPINRKYVLFCIPFLIWLFIYSFTIGSGSYFKEPLIYFLCKIAYTGITFIPVTFMDFLFTFFEKKKEILVKTSYILTIIFAIILWTTPLIISGVHYYPWGVYPKAGPLHPLFLTFFLVGLSFVIFESILMPYSHALSPQKANQGKFLMPFYILLCFDCIDFIPNYGINVYPVGCILTMIFVFSIGYAIVKYQYMDVKIVIRKSLVYSLLITSMTILYFLSIFLSERILQSIVGYKTFLGSLIASLILAFTFIPLKNYFQKLVDKIILGKTPAEMAEENVLLQQELTRREKYKMAAALAGGVAHEIKNPLTAIGTFIEQFPDKKDDPEFMNKFHRLATQELSRVRELSAQLMDFAKPAELKLSKFEVHSLLNDVLMLMNSRLKHQDIKLNKQFSSTPLILTADRDQIKQVLLNLVLNALDVMPDGGTLTVTTRMDDTVRAQRAVPLQNNQIQISISDTGSGISPEHQKKLFEPFFTTKPEGTGLGLSICKRIIEEHGGKIEVKSVVNQGTTFSIHLPIAESPGGARG